MLRLALRIGRRGDLADVREIVREPCGRRERYNIERLVAKHGADVPLRDLKTILANCEQGAIVLGLLPVEGQVRAL